MRLGRLMWSVAGMTLAGVALAQGPGTTGGGSGPGPMMGGGYGPGMMRGGASGYECGPGMMGGGYGPGMMGGGYGPGMMGGGYGPGMMGGDYGPGMMGGGPGMRGGAGRGGMMGYGYGMQGALDLSDDQRKKVDAVHDELQSRTWEITGEMRAEMAKMREAMASEPRDKAALDASYKRLNELRQQRFDARLAARDQMDAVLTKEQRQSMRRWGPWWMDDGD